MVRFSLPGRADAIIGLDARSLSSPRPYSASPLDPLASQRNPGALPAWASLESAGKISAFASHPSLSIPASAKHNLGISGNEASGQSIAMFPTGRAVT